jgi:hypothetical protein
MSGTGNTAGNPAGSQAGSPALRVIRGAVGPALYLLSGPQQTAVGALVEPHTGYCDGFCTGTLISNNVVLTAAHCVLNRNPRTFEFVLGGETAFPVKRYAIAAVSVNPAWDRESPAHDNALVFLRETVPATLATPIPINKTALPSNLLGKQVQNVGYGVTEPNMMSNVNPRRLWTVEPVRAVTSLDFTVDGGQISSVCGGDSGSPSLFKFPDGVIRIIGTLHGGDMSCTGADTFARVDVDAAWILSGGRVARTTMSGSPPTKPPYLWIVAGSAVLLCGVTAAVVIARRKQKPHV